VRDGEPGGRDEKERPCLGVGDVNLLFHERHERREDEASHEIQKEKTGKEENRSGFGAERFWYGARFIHGDWPRN
jgi:hypothetical protein